MSMQIIINETNAHETLTMNHPGTDVDCVTDFVGNNGALADGQFVRDDDADAYRCDQETYEWWARVISEHEALEERIYELRDEHGWDAVQDAIGNAADCDLEDIPANVNAALDEAFGEEA